MTLIIDYFEAQSPAERKLMPHQAVPLADSLRTLGLGTAIGMRLPA
ncbi:hypothetical protein C4J87_2438 [Pseudomonas sp. R1-43-08]|nr:hypothetical protein C4J87_2438 [Pseudomonas sp. R1-43-08]AZF53104.1 hypothetical protein C4J85_2619 [Pseudomonas sp. R4-34-07]